MIELTGASSLARRFRLMLIFATLAGMSLSLVACGGAPRNFRNENDRLRRENSDLRDRASQLDQQVLDLSLQVNTLNKSLTPEGLPPEVDPTLVPRITSIRFDRFSGSFDSNGDSRDDRVRVYLRTQDQKGRFMPAVGRAVLQAVAIRPEQPPLTLVEKVFEPAEFDAAYRSGMTGTHYTLEADLPVPMPAGVTSATLKVTFTDALRGVSFTHEQVIELRGLK